MNANYLHLVNKIDVYKKISTRSLYDVRINDVVMILSKEFRENLKECEKNGSGCIYCR